MKIGWVFFDAVGTLFRVRGSVGAIYSRQALLQGIQVGEQQMEKAFQTAFREMPPLAFGPVPEPLARDLEKRWWKRVVARSFELAGAPSQLEVLGEALYDIFRSGEGWVLEPGCPECLEQLKGQGQRLGVISNFDSRLEEVLKSLGIRDFFQTVTVSSRSGAAKPQAAIFGRALGEAGAPAHESLHVGDDLRGDFWAARAAGLRALLYDPQDRFAAEAGEDRIRSLTEVASVLV